MAEKKDVVKFASCGGLESQIAYLKLAVLQPIAKKGSTQTLEQRFGVPPPKGILFYGPPGTGKTRLAQALSNELADSLNMGKGEKVHFIYRKGRDVAGPLFGQSSQNLRRVFEEAKENAPCIIFFDELDGLCPTRNNSHVSEGSTTIVTTMLGLMDEVPQGEVFIIGATNRLDGIDPAIRRPGRFDKHIEFHLPTDQGRQNILHIHTKSWKVKPTQEIFKYCREKTKGYSGADLEKLCLDAFDNAVSRVIKSHRDANPRRTNLAAMDFSMLNVELSDWQSALGRMRPSNQTATFGSAVYVPSTVSETNGYMERLIRDDLSKVQRKLNNIMERGNSPSNIRSFYMWSAYENDPSNFDQLIIDPALRSESLEKIPVYVISPDTLSSKPVQEWAAMVNNTFDQALNQCSKTILYIQSMEDVTELIYGYNVETEVNMEYQLERLRGSSVLLLLTGNLEPANVYPDSPFQRVLAKRTEEEQQSVGAPSEDSRKTFFRDFLFACVARFKPARDDAALQQAVEKAVEYTADKNLDRVLLLHKNLLMRVAEDSDETNFKKAMMNILQTIEYYHNNDL